MSDKSFGDFVNRGAEKNPLLSTAVTGLSFEDLSHNAVLLPVPRTLAVTSTQDIQQSGHKDITLAHTNLSVDNYESGDANFNQIKLNATETSLNYQNSRNDDTNISEIASIQTHTQSKASAKSEDDFDVNEYIARLQSSVYVSAPLNSHMTKEDNNAALKTEENLEEVNLNETDKVEDVQQQSFSADIAQNFSQLPTVLPQVASAVFSSFSNMLNYKSRDQTPDDRSVDSGYQNVQVEVPQDLQGAVPLVGVSEPVKEVQAPPKQPPIGGISNYRITTKKKAYAQIPGLSTGDSAQIPVPNTNIPQIPFNTSNVGQVPNLPPTGQTVSYFTPDCNVQATNYKAPEAETKAYNVYNPLDFGNSVKKIEETSIDYATVNKDNIESNVLNTANVQAQFETLHVEIQTALVANVPPASIPGASIIPPPPMFSNLPRRNSQTAPKSILPPSVARRLAGNTPLIKPPANSVKPYTDNIFVPSLPADNNQTQSFLEQKTNEPVNLSAVNSVPPTQTLPPPSSFYAPTNVPPKAETFPSIPVTSDNKTSCLDNPNASTVGIEQPIIFNPKLNQAFEAKSETSLSIDQSSSISVAYQEKETITAVPTFDVTKSNRENLNTSNTNIAPPVSFMTPSQVIPPHPASFVAPTAALPTANPSIFNPYEPQEQNQGEQILSYFNSQPPQEPPKQVPEPPKINSNLNFRMTKKRPQYYAGPIEGIGDISNNVKPTIAPVQTTAFQGALFTPEAPIATENPEPIGIPDKAQTTVPFGVQQQNTPASYVPYDWSTHQEVKAPDVATVFDLSRPTTDSYDPPKEESKGFGIIGSLKSKLSSLDINKIQSSVTTFFDPAYNSTKEDFSNTSTNYPYETAPISGYGTQTIDNTFGIFVPSDNQQPQCNYYDNYQNNDQVYGYQNQANQYQNQGYYQNPVQNVASDNYTQTSTAYSYPPNYSEAIAMQEAVTSAKAVKEDNKTSQVIKSEQDPNSRISPLLENESKAFYTTANSSTTNTFFNVTNQLNDTQASRNFFQHQSLDVKKDLWVDQTNSHNDDKNKSNAQHTSFYSPYEKDKPLDLFTNLTPTEKSPEKVTNIESSEIKIHQKQENETQSKDSEALTLVPTTTYEDDITMLENNSINFSTDNFTENPVSGDDPEFYFDNLVISDRSDEFDESKKDAVTDIDICKTCREVEKDEDNIAENLTDQLIENIIAPIQLSNPVEVPLTESGNIITDDRINFDVDQCAEISNITEKTIEHIHVKAASELLDENDGTAIDSYGWNVKTNATYPDSNILMDHNYDFEVDENTIGFSGNNSLFFDNLPRNASDELKAEIKNTYDETSPTLTRQMSIPTAPLEDDLDDTKSDGTGGLDVNSIEQDATKDFPIYEEYVEPSETDDDKIEYIEREKGSNDPISYPDTFTNRVERFKMMGENGIDANEDDSNFQNNMQLFEFPSATSPAITIASYFDTGNYAADTYYRNSIPPPTTTFGIGSQYLPMKIPPGFEDEYRRRLSAMSYDGQLPDNVPVIPDTTTQTKTTHTYSYVQNTKVDDCITQSNISVLDAIPSSQLSCTTSSYVISSKVQEDGTGITEDIRQNLACEASTEKLTDSSTTFSPFGNKLDTLKIDNDIFEKEAKEKLITEDISTESGVIKNVFETFKDEVTEKPLVTFIEQNTPSAGDNIFGSNQTKPIVEKDAKDDKNNQLKQQLPDPINFFSTEPSSTSNDDAGFSRLASYFSSPPKTDHSKSFFELSQSQRHYRQTTISQTKKPEENIPEDNYAANIDLMKDLTSASNLNLSQNDQIVRTVNFFTVIYDNEELNVKVNKNSASNTSIDDNNNNNINKENVDNKVEKEMEETDVASKLIFTVNNCNKCNVDSESCDNLWSTKDNNLDSLVRTIINTEDSKSKSDSHITMDGTKPIDKKGSININLEGYDAKHDSEDGLMLMNENRPASEYSPVRHHWFYRVDFDDKSIWRGFSTNDSRALEEAFNRPDLNEGTLVPTDGGRFDVNIIGRLRIAVYWSDKPTNVRRCSWFYKGTTDARYVPYTEDIAIKLEEEYRHGMTTGEWHRRLSLPNNETVVMHGPAVMVHFLQGAVQTDSFTPSSMWTLSKRVYRNPLRIKVTNDQPFRIDHLLLLVHGIGEHKFHKEKEFQSAMRPRVVRRGHDESEIEDNEPSGIDHLLLLCHGVGSACDMRFRPVEEVVDDFRATSLQLIQSHYRSSYDQGVVGRVEVLPVSWHSTLHSGDRGVDKRLAQLTLDSIPRLRNFTNDTVLDVLFYTSPIYCQTIIDTVCKELNRIYNLFKCRNPNFNGAVSLGGHSLGSVILYDLLCHQQEKPTDDIVISKKTYINGSSGTEQPLVKYPHLDFAPSSLFALGSPIAIFECIRGVEALGKEFSLPTCNNFFNIFHPYDPIAYRIEPLINSQLKNVKPFLIPHHKGRKRMHLELKDTMARVGADLKQKLLESIKTTWTSVWRTQPASTHQLEKVVEEEIEKEQAIEENAEDTTHTINITATPDMLGSLNDGRRVDYVLQEAPIEMINEYLFAMTSHVCYWDSEDTMLLILREIYESLGVQPDCSLPQQRMTVQRTKDENPSQVTEAASTSRNT